jgi:hypothetical protein
LVTLGCNPSASDITAALGSATATAACSTPIVTFTDGAVTSSGCSFSQVRTFIASDGCGNSATAIRTVNWTSDLVPPSITATGTTNTLGCVADISAALGSAIATAACGSPAVSVSDGAVQSNSCSRSQTRTFSASDGCGNSATASSTVTWTSDQTPPTFTGNYNDVTLGL